MRVVFKVRGGRGGGCRDLVSSSSTRKLGYHLTSNKKTCPADFIIFPQVPRTARAEATSFVRETCEDRYDLKGTQSHYTVRLRVLVQKQKPTGVVRPTQAGRAAYGSPTPSASIQKILSARRPPSRAHEHATVRDLVRARAHPPLTPSPQNHPVPTCTSRGKG